MGIILTAHTSNREGFSETAPDLGGEAGAPAKEEAERNLWKLAEILHDEMERLGPSICGCSWADLSLERRWFYRLCVESLFERGDVLLRRTDRIYDAVYGGREEGE
jgi:hypothetical protein